MVVVKERREKMRKINVHFMIEGKNKSEKRKGGGGGVHP
jgi:hypothetical protein